MGAILNGLAGLLSGGVGQSGAAPADTPTMDPITITQDPAYAASQAATKAAPTDVDAVTVQAKKPPLDYDNTQTLSSVDNSLNQEAAYRQANPRQGATSYGILPPDMQHGTLSKVLGLLGDAYLVHHGRAPAYLQAQQAQQEGDAMAGMTQNPGAAAERVAATGVPGATDLADKIYQQSNQANIAKGQLQLNNFYRENQVRNQQDNQLRQMTPQIGGMAAQARTAADYAKAHATAEAVAQRIGPNYHASDFGLVDPDEWTPGASPGLGMSANNVQQSSDRAAQRAQSGANAQTAAGARMGAARIMAGSHQPSMAGMDQQILAKVANGTATPAEAAYASGHLTNQPRAGAARAIPGAAQQGGGHQQFIEGRQYRDAHGNVATFRNGKFQ